DFAEFDRGAHPHHVFFASMTQYDETYDILVAFPPSRPKHILADVLAENNLAQLRIAETEKYAHVTFFFSGGEEIKRPLEDRLLIPSPKIATYDLKPEMSSNEVTEEVVKQINSDKFDIIILNFANPDMVGHTGIFEAAKAAIEAIDTNLGKIIEVVKKKEGIILITADHGNSEKMFEASTDKPYTAHTTSKVPFLMINGPRKPDLKLREDGILADIAPTMLDILGIEKPKEMTGKSLINK
ncbi:MAG: 2,3-bisphosphoglycerate-independent phosphoglycerate mutase, partial [Actinobacteria bacterium]